MAKLRAYFIFSLLLSLILGPEIHAVEARLLFKESRWQPNQLKRILLSHKEVEPAESGPSPGAGHEFGPKESSKRSTNPIVTGYSSPGVGHAFGPREDGKGSDIVVSGKSGPSPGVGHAFGPKEVDSKMSDVGVTGYSVPSPGVGHRKYYGNGTLTSVESSGPSPGEGHKQVRAQPDYGDKP